MFFLANLYSRSRIADRSTDGSSSFLVFWNGTAWSAIGSTLQQSTDVSQLVMVPLQNTHTANSIVEQDRMLLLSGSLFVSSSGNASSVLFDGQNFIPYLQSSSSTGTLGSVSSLIHSLAEFSFTQRRKSHLVHISYSNHAHRRSPLFFFFLSIYRFARNGHRYPYFHRHSRRRRFSSRSHRYSLDPLLPTGRQIQQIRSHGWRRRRINSSSFFPPRTHQRRHTYHHPRKSQSIWCSH